MTSKTPLRISKKALRRIVMKAYRLSDTLPDYFPSVEDIDTLLESKSFLDPQVREDSYKFFVMYVAMGFTRDKLWHSIHPGKRYITADNLIEYLYTPLDGEAGISLHVNIWDEDISEEEKEDRQAAFEYMQSLIMDESIYTLIDDAAAEKTAMAS